MINHSNIQNIVLFAIIFIVILVALIFIFVIKAQQKIISKELQTKNLELEFQKQMFSKVIEIQENERKRIAQNLHDEISSKLIALSLNLHLLKSEKSSNLEKENSLQIIEKINKETIETSRNISHNLFPPILEKFGLNEAFEEMFSELNKSKQIEIQFYSEINLSELLKNSQLHLYRIIQELINNSIKHGKATKVNINFNQFEKK